MRRVKFSKKLNNKGSSLMFVLIAIAFVSILTAVIISAASTNYRLKVMNNRTQKTFYSAEVALEEVYAGFGKATCDQLENCYLTIAKNLAYQITIEGEIYSTNIDNEAANKQLKEDFFTAMHEKLNGATVDRAEVLSSYLTDPSGATVVDAGTVVYKNDHNDDDKYLKIEDVIISYKEGGYDYYSTVAVDIEVKYPDEEFDFMSNTRSNLQTFLEYCIIAMDGIYVGDGSGSSSKGDVSGGVFAGTNGINIDENSTVNFGIADVNKKTTVVTPGDINVFGTFNFNNGDLWCKNINVGNESQHNVNVVFQPSTRVFVADDLNIEGNNCSVTLGKEYIGYGDGGTVAASSAIVINGRGNSLSATELSKFVLAGRAYIDFENEESSYYMTADSLGLKGIQKIYLVPFKFLVPTGTAEVSNPTNNSLSVDVDLDDFYARDLLADIPYKVVQVEDMFYFYLNFASPEAQRIYVETIISETTYESRYPSATEEDDSDRDKLKEIITSSMNKFILTGVIDLGFDADAKYYTAGNLYEVTGGAMNSNENSDEIDDVAAWCNDKENRFSILQTYLFDMGATSSFDNKYATMPNSFYILGTQYQTDGWQLYTAYERILDIEKLSSTEDNYITYRPDGTISAVIVDGTFTVPDSVIGGVIVAYNEDIVVKNSFEGLIITNGKVTTITDSGEIITNGVREIASRILDEDIYLSQFFYAYQMESTAHRATSTVEVDEVLSFDNWRKNYAD